MLPLAMGSDAGEACGGVEQDGSHESARRKREDHEDEERENINKPLLVEYSSAVRNY